MLCLVINVTDVRDKKYMTKTQWKMDGNKINNTKEMVYYLYKNEIYVIARTGMNERRQRSYYEIYGDDGDANHVSK